MLCGELPASQEKLILEPSEPPSKVVKQWANHSQPPPQSLIPITSPPFLFPTQHFPMYHPKPRILAPSPLPPRLRNFLQLLHCRMSPLQRLFREPALNRPLRPHYPPPLTLLLPTKQPRATYTLQFTT